jgi:hypothetical protein
LRTSEFLHLARKPLRVESSTVGVPQVEMMNANPRATRVAALADVNGARSVAFVVAAVVMFHGFGGSSLVKWEGTPRARSYRDGGQAPSIAQIALNSSVALVRAGSLGTCRIPLESSNAVIRRRLTEAGVAAMSVKVTVRQYGRAVLHGGGSCQISQGQQGHNYTVVCE